MGHQHGIRGGELGVPQHCGGELGVPQHCNATQNQSLTPLVQQLLRVIVAPDNMKTVPFKKTDVHA